MAEKEVSPGTLAAGAILFEEITKQFPKEPVPAVNHINLSVAAGNLVVLLGPSGCGKTTLLKMVNRLYEPTSGRIYLEGTDVEQLPVTELRRRIGYVIQQVGLFPHMNIEKNIAVVPELLGWDRAKTNQRIDFLLDMVGLPQSYRKRRPRQLSGGEQQRVGLARALAADPDIMLMDEPFAAIDAITRVRLQGELLDIQSKLRKTILFVTHDVEEALRLADRIAVLRAGRLLQYGTPLEILTRPENAFVGELVGGGDVLRRLSLYKIQSVIAARADREPKKAQAPDQALPAATVHVGDDLRTALARLLESGAGALTVVDQDSHPVGQVTFDDLRLALVNNEIAVQDSSR
ncbi:MAG: ABC transporter ATP-binding protein [Omnitrophica WOR_2 bacterium]